MDTVTQIRDFFRTASLDEVRQTLFLMAEDMALRATSAYEGNPNENGLIAQEYADIAEALASVGPLIDDEEVVGEGGGVLPSDDDDEDEVTMKMTKQRPAGLGLGPGNLGMRRMWSGR